MRNSTPLSSQHRHMRRLSYVIQNKVLAVLAPTSDPNTPRGDTDIIGCSEMYNSFISWPKMSQSFRVSVGRKWRTEWPPVFTYLPMSSAHESTGSGWESM